MFFDYFRNSTVLFKHYTQANKKLDFHTENIGFSIYIDRTYFIPFSLHYERLQFRSLLKRLEYSVNRC